jgi:translation initiation factor 2B subunit (eIF-2B alpha/beta/delta family)
MGREELEAISTNRTKGASLLTDEAIDFVLKLLRDGAGKNEVEEGLILIYLSHPVLAPLFHLIAIYCLYERSGRELLIQIYEQWKARLAEDRPRAVKRAVERLEGYRSFATLSYSSFVLQFFSQMATRGKTARVLVGESRPGGEGVLTANFLSRLGYEVVLVPDALMPTLVEEVEILLLGVDALSKTFYFHKAGTRPTVIGARLRNIPVCAILTQDKWIPSSWESLFAHQFQKLKQREVTSREEWIEHRLRFDLSPGGFLDLLITPEGAYSHDQLSALYEHDSPLPWTHLDLDLLIDFLISGGEPPSQPSRSDPL